MKHTGPAHLLRLLNPLFLLGVNPAALGADSLRGPNIVLTSDAPGVRVEGAFERIRAPQSRSAAVLQAVDGGTHRVLFNAALGVSGYYRVLLWWPQVRGAADVVVDGLNGRAATRVDPGLRSGLWVAAGVFALPADHAQIEVSAPAA